MTISGGVRSSRYKNPNVKLSFRLDAATAAAPYEKPKLASTEIKGDGDKPLEHKLTIEFAHKIWPSIS